MNHLAVSQTLVMTHLKYLYKYSPGSSTLISPPYLVCALVNVNPLKPINVYLFLAVQSILSLSTSKKNDSPSYNTVNVQRPSLHQNYRTPRFQNRSKTNISHLFFLANIQATKFLSPKEQVSTRDVEYKLCNIFLVMYFIIYFSKMTQQNQFKYLKISEELYAFKIDLGDAMEGIRRYNLSPGIA